MSAASVTKNRPLKPGRKIRIPLSCEPCRSRKLKCDRVQPCQNCTVRENAAGCFFRGVDKAPPAVPGTRSAASASGMQQRIDRLENLVTSLMEGQGTAKPQTPPDGNGDWAAATAEKSSGDGLVSNELPPAVQHGMGVLTVNGNSSLYYGTTHWHDVLKEINELKSYWGQVQDEEEEILHSSAPSDFADGPSLFCGMVQPIGFDEILATLPSKPAADKLMHRFFQSVNSPVPTFHILHEPTFMKEYQTHWQNPKKSSIMWIGLLCAVLSQAMISYHLSEDEPLEYVGISQSISELYRLRTAQCLMLGDISKCSPYTLEAMVHYTMSEWARKTHNESRVWMMVGLLVRVALQMGYHRDPSHYPTITICQGEIRRRIWGFIQGCDALTSFLVGLPGMIRSVEQDVAVPRNLHDWELTEDLTELPPSRPSSEITSVSYLLTKGRIIDTIGKIVDFMSSLHLWDYESVLKLDQQLEKAFQDIPEYFRMQSNPGDEEPSLLNRRIQLVFLYHQAVCVLHRKFVAQGRSDERFARSRSRCIESAMALLTQQHYLYVESRIKRSLASKHWYRASYTSQEYTLAAMIVVLELRQRRVEVFSGDLEARMNDEKQMLKALEIACTIWHDVDDSSEAVKVYKVLTTMLVQLRLASFGEVALQPQDTSQIPGLPTEEGSWSGATGLPLPDDMTIDWSAWDTYIEGSSFEDVYGSVSFQ